LNPLRKVALSVPAIRQLHDARNALLAERDALAIERNALLAERDALATERNALLAERDALATERSALLAARDALANKESGLFPPFGSSTDIDLPPVALDYPARAEMTASCRDCDQIPKVPHAGKVISFEGKSVQIMHNGVRVVAGGYYGGWMTGIIERLRGHHEPQEEVIFHEVLKLLPPAATMLELGGFWSYYSLWFKSQHSDQRKAYVVEPDPNYIAIGRGNAMLNNHEITFVQASVGAELIPSATFTTESAGEVQIPQISVASFLHEHRIPKLDILHCDTQGAETAVIRSCEALFRGHTIRFGIFSTHSHHISRDPLTHQRCLAMLRDFGGTILAEHDVHESFSGDGLIAAYFGREPLEWKEPPITRNRYSTSLFRNPLYDLAAKW
jgi:FkbM family methyltransferase